MTSRSEPGKLMKISAEFIKNWRHEYIATKLGISPAEAACSVLKLWSHLQENKTDTFHRAPVKFACVAGLQQLSPEDVVQAFLDAGWFVETEEGYFAESFRENNERMFNAWLSGKKRTTTRKGSTPEVVDRWNEMAKLSGLASIRMVSDSRREKIAVRMKSDFFKDNYQQALEIIPQSDFLMGKRGSWKANFDWFIRSDEQVMKIIEGVYGGVEIKSAKEERVTIYEKTRTGVKPHTFPSQEKADAFIAENGWILRGDGCYQADLPEGQE